MDEDLHDPVGRQWAEKEEEVVCTKGCNHKSEKVLQVKFPLVASPPCWLIG